MTQLLERLFKLESHGTNPKKELIAGLTTFVTMAYIILVNPQIMSAAGMDPGASFVGTCIAAAFACFVMGLYANWPVGLAPGMGLNAFFTFTVVIEMGYSWEVALGAVFLAGILFFFSLFITFTPLLGPILGIIGATFVWEWNIFLAFFLFFRRFFFFSSTFWTIFILILPFLLSENSES